MLPPLAARRPSPAASRRRTTPSGVSSRACGSPSLRRHVLDCRAASSPRARRCRPGGRRTACRPARPGSRSRAACLSRRRARSRRLLAGGLRRQPAPGEVDGDAGDRRPRAAARRGGLQRVRVQGEASPVVPVDVPAVGEQRVRAAVDRLQVGTARPPVLTLCQCSPPSSVAHSSGPNAQPYVAFRNRRPGDAVAPRAAGVGAGRPCQVWPPSWVRAIDVQMSGLALRRSARRSPPAPGPSRWSASPRSPRRARSQAAGSQARGSSRSASRMRPDAARPRAEGSAPCLPSRVLSVTGSAVELA